LDPFKPKIITDPDPRGTKKLTDPDRAFEVYPSEKKGGSTMASVDRFRIVVEA